MSFFDNNFVPNSVSSLIVPFFLLLGFYHIIVEFYIAFIYTVIKTNIKSNLGRYIR